MPSSIIMDTKGAKLVIVTPTGNEKSDITVKLGVTADGRTLPTYVILARKMLPREELPAGIVRTQKGVNDSKIKRNLWQVGLKLFGNIDQVFN